MVKNAVGYLIYLVSAAITVLLFLLIYTFFSNAHAGTAFYKYQHTDGLYKACVYEYLGSRHVVITVKSSELCPLTIEWPRKC